MRLFVAVLLNLVANGLAVPLLSTKILSRNQIKRRMFEANGGYPPYMKFPYLDGFKRVEKIAIVVPPGMAEPEPSRDALEKFSQRKWREAHPDSDVDQYNQPSTTEYWGGSYSDKQRSRYDKRPYEIASLVGGHYSGPHVQPVAMAAVHSVKRRSAGGYSGGGHSHGYHKPKPHSGGGHYDGGHYPNKHYAKPHYHESHSHGGSHSGGYHSGGSHSGGSHSGGSYSGKKHGYSSGHGGRGGGGGGGGGGRGGKSNYG